MTRTLGLTVLVLLAVGCATTSSIKEEIGPLADRVAKLERQAAATDAKLSEVTNRADAQAADVQALRKDVADSSAAAQKAQQAAADARAAAAEAEAAAARSAKAFELRQMKGSR